MVILVRIASWGVLISTVFLSIPFVCGKMNKKYFYFRGITFYFTYTTVDHTNFIYLTTKDMFGLLLKFAVLKCGSGFTGCPFTAQVSRMTWVDPDSTSLGSFWARHSPRFLYFILCRKRIREKQRWRLYRTEQIFLTCCHHVGQQVMPARCEISSMMPSSSL